MIDGATRLIAHVGHPTATFKSPMIYNPYFRSIGLNVAVVPMGVTAENRETGLGAIFRFTNVMGALITMPHKVAVMPMLDEVSTTAQVAGACNAVLIRPDGTLLGDMFDGEGFVSGMLAKGRTIAGQSALVIGAGGVGSAIAASLAKAGAARIALYDVNSAAAEALAGRILKHYPNTQVMLGSNDPADHGIVVNASPLGMAAGDPMPLDVSQLNASTFVGEVVLAQETTAFLAAAQARGCSVQIGLDMLFEQIPAYLTFFGLPTTTPETLRRLAELSPDARS